MLLAIVETEVVEGNQQKAANEEPPPVPAKTGAFSSASPWVTVRPEMLTVPLSTLKMRLALLPLTPSLLAPGPSMLKLSVMVSSPLVSVMW